MPFPRVFSLPIITIRPSAESYSDCRMNTKKRWIRPPNPASVKPGEAGGVSNKPASPSNA